MRTVITFADLYRENPVVLAAKWPEFVLLFNAEDDGIRVRQHWDRVAEPADFVLTVKTFTTGKKGWTVCRHKDSPSSMSLPHAESLYPLYQDVDCKQLQLAPGGMKYFAPRSFYRHGGFGMMLDSEDNKEEDPAPDGLFKKPSLENLPAEIHRMLLGRLPVYTALHVLPYVSTKMRDVVIAAGGDWKEVNLFVPAEWPKKMFTPSASDVLTLADLAHESCASLNVGFPQFRLCDLKKHPALNYASNACSTVFWRFQWPCLTELLLDGPFDGFDPYALKGGIRKGNFPGLKILKLLPSKGVSWDVLEDCPMPSLIHLEIAIDATQLPLDIKDRLSFCKQFTLLETLCVIVRGLSSWEGLRVDSMLFPRPERPHSDPDQSFEFLPNLGSLTIGGGPPVGNNTIRDLERFQRQVEVFSQTKVTRLRLCNHQQGRDGREVSVIPGSWLFSTFKHLLTFCSDRTVHLDWRSVPEASLKCLHHLRVAVDDPKKIPFEKMANLEAACIDISSYFRGEQFALASLMQLPRLATVKVISEGWVSLKALTRTAGSVCNIRSLDCFDFCLRDDDETEEVMKFYASFPNLNRLVMPQWMDDDECYRLSGIEERVCSLIKELKGLDEVVVPDCRAYGAKTFMSFFPDHSWQVLLPADTIYAREKSVFRNRRVKQALGKEFFVFEDTFFCQDRFRVRTADS